MNHQAPSVARGFFSRLLKAICHDVGPDRTLLICCKAFNARTAQFEKGTPIPVVITAYQDRSFTFEMKQPPVSFFLKKAVGLKIGKKPASGSKTPGRNVVGKVTKAQIKEIAEKKLVDLNCASIESAMSMIEGSARAMGLQVVE